MSRRDRNHLDCRAGRPLGRGRGSGRRPLRGYVPDQPL